MVFTQRHFRCGIHLVHCAALRGSVATLSNLELNPKQHELEKVTENIVTRNDTMGIELSTAIKHLAVYGAPTLSDFFSTTLPDYSPVALRAEHKERLM